MQEGAHKRKDEWTYFFLNMGEFRKTCKPVVGSDIIAEEKVFLNCLNAVKSVRDSNIKRGAAVTAVRRLHEAPRLPAVSTCLLCFCRFAPRILARRRFLRAAPASEVPGLAEVALAAAARRPLPPALYLYGFSLVG